MAVVDYPILGVVNWLDAGDVTLTSSDVDASSDIDNLKDPNLGSSTLFTNQATNRFVIDLGASYAARTVGMLGLIGNTLPQSSCTVTLEAHTADSWGTPSLTLGPWNSGSLDTWPGFRATRNIFAVAFDASVGLYRYWRVTMTASPAMAPVVRRLFLGPCIQTGASDAMGGITFGSSLGREDESTHLTSEEGVDFRHRRKVRRVVNMKWEGAGDATVLDTIYPDLELGAASSGDVLYLRKNSETDAKRRQLTTVWGPVLNSDQLVLKDYDWWERNYTIRERL